MALGGSGPLRFPMSLGMGSGYILHREKVGQRMVFSMMILVLHCIKKL